MAAAMMVCFLLFQSAAAFAEDVVQPYVSFDMELTAGADVAIIGDTVWTEATFKNYGDDFVCTTIWLINGGVAVGGVTDEFYVTDGATCAFPKEITDEFWDWGSFEIGLEVYYRGELFYKLQKTVTVYNTLADKQQVEFDRVLAKVEPVNVEATLNYSSPLYANYGLTSKIGSVASGTRVTVVGSKTGVSNQIALPDGRTGWVPLSALSISKENYTTPDNLSNYEKNTFVNAKGYASPTDYLVWINLKHQKVNVFIGSQGYWNIEASFPCATGTNETPTIQGVFSYSALQSRWPYNTYYVGPVLIFSGSYAIHSVLLRYDGSVYDGTLGRPASHGCVRLSKADTEWLAYYLPIGTTVVVY